jgi:hypothetical protein
LGEVDVRGWNPVGLITDFPTVYAPATRVITWCDGILREIAAGGRRGSSLEIPLSEWLMSNPYIASPSIHRQFDLRFLRDRFMVISPMPLRLTAK